MSIDRFRLALERTGAGHWERFEQLAQVFLASDFPELRPMAAPSGDRGRDAELYSPNGIPQVLFQFSTSKDWKTKASDTLKRISQNFPQCHTLIYATNQRIGARADALKKESLPNYKISLDIRDCDWFVIRYQLNSSVEKAADDYARQLVDPLLEERGLIQNRPVALSREESQAALIYLELQWENDTREKGLTKLCFEALVRSALRETDSEHRLSRSEVLARVRAILPSHQSEQVDIYSNSALTRLTKRAVRHWMKEDEFCLSNEERTQLSERLSAMQYSASRFSDEIKERLLHGIEGRDDSSEPTDQHVAYVREIVERFLLSRGEAFARSIQRGTLYDLGLDPVREIANSGGSTQRKGLTVSDIQKCIEIAKDILSNPSNEILPHLHRLARAYTLMAFLQETPDVQTATKKMFGRGEIWLDTSIILPVFAETLLDDSARKFTRMLQAAREAGIKLNITAGVIEEVATHIGKCRAYDRPQGEWRGRVPFLSAAFAVNRPAGRAFTTWVDLFAGESQPFEDVAEYLNDFFGVEAVSLEEEINNASPITKAAVKETWINIHQERRQHSDADWNEHLTYRLAEHDTECYLGVLERRSRETGKSQFGHTIWWLTLDSAARQIASKVAERIGTPGVDDPVLSADFLVNYLVLGPNRGRISKQTESSLPLIMEGRIDDVPVELMEVVAEIRERYKDEPDRIIRRHIRDSLNAARQRPGKISSEGLAGVQRSFGI